MNYQGYKILDYGFGLLGLWTIEVIDYYGYGLLELWTSRVMD